MSSSAAGATAAGTHTLHSVGFKYSKSANCSRLNTLRTYTGSGATDIRLRPWQDGLLRRDTLNMTSPTLTQIRHWVFDMDGTLTVGVHDFPAIRRHLEIPEGADILHHLETLPAAERDARHAWLLEHERELAMRSTAATGAIELIQTLGERGCRLGILTRNAKALAHITLEAIGLADCFAPDDVLGRDEAPPKPHPGGLDHFIRRWNVTPAALVMVGDSHIDMACGRAAGAQTVLVNAPQARETRDADWHLADCRALAKRLVNGS